jgi:hypothetical protein
MKPFKDNEGRTWALSVNVASVERVRDLCNIDLTTIGKFNQKVITELADDPIKLVDVVYAICKPEVDARKLSDVDFGTAMGGDSLDAASDALMSEIADFFRSRQRSVLKAALAKMNEGWDLATTKALETVAKLDMAKILEGIGDSSTKSPDASESTPAPLPSAS